jgi:hypothetical protein
MKQAVIISLMCMVLASSCPTKKGEESCMISMELKDSVYSCVRNYMNTYPQFDTFLLICASKLSPIYFDGYLLGPAYEGIYEDGNPCFYITIDNKQVFVQLGIENLIKTTDLQRSIYRQKQIPRGVDSLIIAPDWIKKNGGELYIHRAIYFSIRDEFLSINNRPDTIFGPRLLEGSIQFENGGVQMVQPPYYKKRDGDYEPH